MEQAACEADRDQGGHLGTVMHGAARSPGHFAWIGIAAIGPPRLAIRATVRVAWSPLADGALIVRGQANTSGVAGAGFFCRDIRQ
jgi:hypothetical protein